MSIYTKVIRATGLLVTHYLMIIGCFLDGLSIIVYVQKVEKKVVSGIIRVGKSLEHFDYQQS